MEADVQEEEEEVDKLEKREEVEPNIAELVVEKYALGDFVANDPAIVCIAFGNKVRDEVLEDVALAVENLTYTPQ